MEDIEVIRRVKAGETQVFSLLVKKYHCRLLSFIHGLMADPAVVEDLGQDVFLSVYKSIESFDEKRGTPFSAWLFIIARNRCLSELRKRRAGREIALDRAPDLHDEAAGADDRLAGKERILALEQAMEQVPEPFRSTLLRSLSGIPRGEIAGSDGVSPGTVKSRLFRAREKIRAIIIKFMKEKSDEKV